jgi:hypothetical protein
MLCKVRESSAEMHHILKIKEDLPVVKVRVSEESVDPSNYAEKMLSAGGWNAHSA